jgi:hypothetical protein
MHGVKDPTRRGRKILIASLGVAAVSYVACGGSTDDSTGNPGGAGTTNSGGSAQAGSADTGGSSNNTGGDMSNGTGGSANTGGSVNGGGPIVGNLMAFPTDAGPKDAAEDIKIVVFPDVLVANLIAPPPPDAAKE